MKRSLSCLFLFATTLLAQSGPSPHVAQAGHHLFFHVTVSEKFSKPQSGRLLIFMRKGTDQKEVRPGFVPGETWIAAREVDAIAPGAAVDVDGDEIAFPKGFSQASGGDYQVHARLDWHHDFNYEREEGDWKSGVATLKGFDPANAAPVALTLDAEIPARVPAPATKG